jgi:secreted Zn-dependent insulinase-like peptidase
MPQQLTIYLFQEQKLTEIYKQSLMDSFCLTESFKLKQANKDSARKPKNLQLRLPRRNDFINKEVSSQIKSYKLETSSHNVRFY